MKTIPFAICIAFFAVKSALAQDSYTFTSLAQNPTLSQYERFEVSAMNDAGDLVGTAYDKNDLAVAFRYSATTKSVFLVTNVEGGSWGTGINAAGEIIGNSKSDWFYAKVGSKQEFPGHTMSPSRAVGITTDGTIVGVEGSGFNTRTFLVDPAGGIQHINLQIEPTSVNDSLTMVGNTAPVDLGKNAIGIGCLAAAIYNYQLGNSPDNSSAYTYLAGDPAPFGAAVGKINNDSTVAGTTADARGFVRIGDNWRYFGTHNVMEIGGINAVGDVVATLLTSHGKHPFIFIHGKEVASDLTNFVPSIAGAWTLRTANGINNNSQICGVAVKAGTNIQALYILTPKNGGRGVKPIVNQPLQN